MGGGGGGAKGMLPPLKLLGEPGPPLPTPMRICWTKPIPGIGYMLCKTNFWQRLC